MRCREAKQLLTENEQKNDGRPMPIELARHLKSCPDCARMATAGRIVASGFEDLSLISDFETTPLEQIRARVSRHADQHRQKESTFMFSLWKNLSSHPRVSLGFASGLVALILMATIPISCSRTVGYSVEGTDSDVPTSAATAGDQSGMKLTFQAQESGTPEDMKLKAAKIKEALAAIGNDNDQVVVDEQTGVMTVHIDGLKTRDEAREAAMVLDQFAGFNGDVSIAEQKERVRSSLLSHIAHQVFDLNIDTSGKTDEEIADEIRAQLASQGKNFDVAYHSTDDGRKMIFIGDSAACGQGSMQMDKGTAAGWIACDSGQGMRTIKLEGDGSMSPEDMERALKSQLKDQGGDSVSFRIQLSDDSCCIKR